MSQLDWYDVDSDDDTPIPELPPLPLLKASDSGSLNEATHSCDSTRTCTDDASEHSTSAAGSQRQESPFPSRRELPRDQENHDGNNVNLPQFAVDNKLRTTNRFCFDDAAAMRKQQKHAVGDPIVCFIGNFPPNTSMNDLKQFIQSKGVMFSEIRMVKGPKKRPNSNGFGYVDLLTEEDQEKLLLYDGADFRGRKVRIDQATKKPVTHSSKKKTPRPQARNQYKNHKSVLSRKNANVKYPGHLKLQRAHSEPHMRNFGHGHQTHRSRFFKNGRKAGTRNRGQKGSGKSPKKIKSRKKGGFSAPRREDPLGRFSEDNPSPAQGGAPEQAKTPLLRRTISKSVEPTPNLGVGRPMVPKLKRKLEFQVPFPFSSPGLLRLAVNTVQGSQRLGPVGYVGY